MTQITTCLWCDHNNALEMAEYYTSVFADSKITSTGYYDVANPHIPDSKAWDVMIVEFTLLGNNLFAALNGGPYFKHSCAASWMIPCKDQWELDYYYDKLSAVSEAEMCGWVTDKFGVSWQLTPDNFTEYMRSGEAAKKSKLMAATMEMRRLSFEGIDTAYNS